MYILLQNTVNGSIFITSENTVKERERKQNSLQMANSGNWLYEKNIMVVQHTAYTISEIRLQHKKLVFGYKLKSRSPFPGLYSIQFPGEG